MSKESFNPADMTKGDWEISETSLKSECITAKGTEGGIILVMAEWRKNHTANAEGICRAVNSTYKKGLNPEAMPELLVALRTAKGALKAFISEEAWNETSVKGIIEDAINNCKI